MTRHGYILLSTVVDVEIKINLEIDLLCRYVLPVPIDVLYKQSLYQHKYWTIPHDIYQNIVFPSQQCCISLIRNSQDLTLWSYNGINSRDVPK
jgi:hypothetical protein